MVARLPEPAYVRTLISISGRTFSTTRGGGMYVCSVENSNIADSHPCFFYGTSRPPPRLPNLSQSVLVFQGGSLGSLCFQVVLGRAWGQVLRTYRKIFSRE